VNVIVGELGMVQKFCLFWKFSWWIWRSQY